MYRTHTCGELNMNNLGENVTLSGWIHKMRDFGGMTFIDLRDRYGITQLVFNMEKDAGMCRNARELGREFIIQIEGKVDERSNKNPNILTGDIEIDVEGFQVLNPAKTPPFTIETNTDGGEDLRMKFRYLDLRREVVRKNLELRHRMAHEVRKYLSDQGFLEIETPVLIKSTPEGARDFVVPSRMNPRQFYALPQSPQTFKQLLMVAGLDKYFQIVKCFRDEDLRADRQPEFTQIDCEMSFVERDDVLKAFEGLSNHLFKSVLDVTVDENFPRLPYEEAMEKYGTDKPDIRFGMEISEMTHHLQKKGFRVFDLAEYIGAITVRGCANYSRKQLDELTNWIQRPQIGAKGLIYVKYQEDEAFKSSVDKFFDEKALKEWAEHLNAKPGDLLLLIAGEKRHSLEVLGELRLEMGKRLGLRDKKIFKPLWVVDFPLFEWDDETQRFYAMHHPFTSPVDEDIQLLDTEPGRVRAKAYDLVINGVEIGGGSIRIHDENRQKLMFKHLGFTEEEAQSQFGFLMEAFRYGAPPHGGIAFGFDRWVSLFAGLDSIRDVIAFPKNNAGRDVMINSPAPISNDQLDELSLELKEEDKDE